MITIPKKRFLLIGVGILIGAGLTTTFRFATYKSVAIHYHANFALYINGQRDEFKSFTYYEEIQSCSSQDDTNPKHRVHMHDQKNHSIHVHDSGVTWGQFFANLGYTLGDSLIRTDKGVYLTNAEDNKLEFLLNGAPTSAIFNRVIRSEDVLLVNYGKDSVETLRQRYDGIPNDAKESNTKPDPSSCSGSQSVSFSDRLKKAIGIPDKKQSHVH